MRGSGGGRSHPGSPLPPQGGGRSRPGSPPQPEEEVVTPDRPSVAAADWIVDSPVFNFINNLSPISLPRPQHPAHSEQLFKSLDLAHISSIFASPHRKPAKESKLLIRDDSVQLTEDSHSPNSVRTRLGSTNSDRLTKCKNIVSESCSFNRHPSQASIDSSGNGSNSTSKLPRSIQLGCGSVEADENRNADGKKKITTEDYTELDIDRICSDYMYSSQSGNIVHENQQSDQQKDGLAYGRDYLIAHQSSSDMLRLAPPFEAETQLENSATHDTHLYCSGAFDGSSTDYIPQFLPDACQSQLLTNDQICSMQDYPSNYMSMDKDALSPHLRGMHRRGLFNEKAGAVNKSVKKNSDCHNANSTTPRCKTSCRDNSSKPIRISKDQIVPQDSQSSINQTSNIPCAVASSPTLSEANIVNVDSSQTIVVANAVESGQASSNKKRHKFDNGGGASCKRCSCKRSKCLKLYCECFHAGVFCSVPCSCLGCLNNPGNMETVLSTREQIESRNRLAFAPKVIRTSEPGQELEDDSNKTPASAHHKRGCNCKKSFCLKKYCECYQGGAGCSLSCRCEGCKNSFGRREGFSQIRLQEGKRGNKENIACAKEEKSEIDKHLVIYQAAYPTHPENVQTPPSFENSRPLSVGPVISKKQRSSAKIPGPSTQFCNSGASLKTDYLLSPFESYTEMILGENTSDNLKEEGSPPQTSVKVVSPNKKRISPPRIGTGLSPICKSGRRLIFKSLPSFPSLCGDENNADPSTRTPAP